MKISRNFSLTVLVAMLLFAGVSTAATRVAILPFEDRVKLTEAWDLSVDIPRWFSQTIDTIGVNDSAIVVVPFDTVSALIKQNKWRRNDFSTGPVIRSIAQSFNADYVLNGRVSKFVVVKRGMNASGTLSGTHSLGTGGGVVDLPASTALQSYRAEVDIDVEIFGNQGNFIRSLHLYSTEKDGGLKIYLPFLPENDEANFHFLSRTPFGSVYFHRSVAGAIMKRFSADINTALQTNLSSGPLVVSTAPSRSSSEFIEGTILEITGSDIYISLGSADSLFTGALLTVYKTGMPVLGPSGDTLGFTEIAAGTIMVRFVRSTHFSLASAATLQDSVMVGWKVRPKNQ